MPITPLHLGLLAPINLWLPWKVSNVSFILATLWIDAGAIAYYAMGLDWAKSHPPESHSLLTCLALAGIVAFFGIRSLSWVLGAFLGAISHVLLDAIVHAEMLPLYPLQGSPFYWGSMTWLSLVLVPPFVWLIAQYVSAILGWARKRQEARSSKSA